MQSAQHELKVLLSSYHSLITIEGKEEERILYALRGVAAQMRMDLIEWTSAQGLKGLPLVEGGADTHDPKVALNLIKKYPGPIILWLKDFTKELEDRVVSRLLQEIVSKFENSLSAVIVTGQDVKLNEEFRSSAIRFELPNPSRDEYRQAVENVYDSLSRTQKINFQLSKEDLSKFLDLLRGMTLKQARQIAAQAFLSENTFNSSDLNLIEKKKIQFIEEDGLIDYYPPQELQYELGGFVNLKSWLKKMEAGFSEEARAMNLPQPKGVLFVGVPGCGKSLAAKYISQLWRLPLLKLDAGRLYNKYIGETEKNLRRAIQLSEDISPSVLWIDEIEKSLTTSSAGSDMDGGVSKRMFATFLTWLQEKSAPVFVVATANDLQALPAELLRKGRFDEIFFIDLPNDMERAEIFKIHLHLRKLVIDHAKLMQLVEMTSGFSGAEIEQVVVGAGLTAIQEKTNISMEILKTEIQNTKPLSVSRADYVDDLRKRAASFRPVN